jgi:hypothetical protein
MSKSAGREEKRLRRIFERAMLIALAAPVFIPLACGMKREGTESSAAAGAAGNATSAGNAGAAGNTSSAGNAGAGGTGMDGGATGGSAAGPCKPFEFTPDPIDTCGNYMQLPCGLPPGVVAASDCFLPLNDCAGICPGPFFNCHAVDQSCVDASIVMDAEGGVAIDCTTCPNGVGRIPAGLLPARRGRRAGAALGDYFAAASHLEAASVHAFRRLRGELSAHRAPARLMRAAGRAQRDEVRHARLTARLARRFGAVPAAVRLDAVAPRTLEEIAVENAVEGCVRETFGALVASFQAANARDPEIARVMAAIAVDETRHAALSWSVARWALRRLGGEARARLAERCRGAVEGLRREARLPVEGDLAAQAGLPTSAQQRALIDALEQQLWASPAFAA